MSRILVIGGYGGFGARLSRRLAANGHRVLVGGRSADKAAAMAATIDGAEPVVIDRNGDVGAVLVNVRPELVVDAAGPFQGSGYRVPKACISLGIPYLDLADAREFVCGIDVLDGAAQTAGVAVVSGASSVPALSGAVARHLAEGLDRVTSVETALSASSRSSAGRSVVQAVLSYVGMPVRLWRGGLWQQRPGWQDLRRQNYAAAGFKPLNRIVALCDVPDLQLLPASLPGQPSVTFRAGNESSAQMVVLWLLSWPVRWGWLRSPHRLARWFLPLQQRLARWSSDRSAMAMTMKGWSDGRPVTKRWTIVAEQGDGPEIPTLAGELLAEDLLAGRVAPGARHGAGLLSLDRFEPLFGRIAVRQETVELETSEPLYRRLLGESFDRLPASVRSMHEVHGDAGAAGEGEVKRGGGLLGRLIGAIVGFPPAGTYPVHVEFLEQGGRERWIRHFGPHRFWSWFSIRGGLLYERFGLLRFGFELPCDESALRMRLVRWSAAGVPLPLFLAPRVNAREWQEDDRFLFDDRITMPLIGELIHYSGWLRPVGAAGQAATDRSLKTAA